MKIINENTVELTEAEQAIKTTFEGWLTAGWSVTEGMQRIKHLHPNEDPAFYEWMGGQRPLVSVEARFYHDNTDVYIVIINNGDTEPELWGFHSADMAQEFAAFRGGDVEDITILGNIAGREAIENERKL